MSTINYDKVSKNYITLLKETIIHGREDVYNETIRKEYILFEKVRKEQKDTRITFEYIEKNRRDQVHDFKLLDKFATNNAIRLNKLAKIIKQCIEKVIGTSIKITADDFSRFLNKHKNKLSKIRYSESPTIKSLSGGDRFMVMLDFLNTKRGQLVDNFNELGTILDERLSYIESKNYNPKTEFFKPKSKVHLLYEEINLIVITTLVFDIQFKTLSTSKMNIQSRLEINNDFKNRVIKGLPKKSNNSWRIGPKPSQRLQRFKNKHEDTLIRLRYQFSSTKKPSTELQHIRGFIEQLKKNDDIIIRILNHRKSSRRRMRRITRVGNVKNLIETQKLFKRFKIAIDSPVADVLLYGNPTKEVLTKLKSKMTAEVKKIFDTNTITENEKYLIFEEKGLTPPLHYTDQFSYLAILLTMRNYPISKWNDIVILQKDLIMLES